MLSAPALPERDTIFLPDGQWRYECLLPDRAVITRAFEGMRSKGLTVESSTPLPTNSSDTVFVGYPMRPGVYQSLKEEWQRRIALERASKRSMQLEAYETSDYCRNFNHLWVAAFNQHRFTHWAMRHDDVFSGSFWADLLIDEMNRVGADVVSAVVALKDDTGETSTAIRDPLTGTVKRLNLQQIHEQLPETFSIEDVRQAGFRIGPDDTLLINTGLWVIRFDHPAIRKFPGFQTEHFLHFKADGNLEQSELTEDWNFSEWARRQGLKVFATRKVTTIHQGDWVRDAKTGEKVLDPTGKPFRHEYRSDHAWGRGK